MWAVGNLIMLISYSLVDGHHTLLFPFLPHSSFLFQGFRLFYVRILSYRNLYFPCKVFSNSVQEKNRFENPILLTLCSLSTVLYSTVQYSTVQYSTVQYSTVQYSTVQYSTVQYNTVQYSTDHLTLELTSF